ncbi:MAG: Holliday junction branch migration protein RuvA [Deltaproteobacteria bacterium]|nr:Holliday junction branch migration protein RuvA [Deltaproteobacteria bacterium]
MIAHIEGVLLNKSVESIVIDVGGVGYEVRVPLSTYYKLPDLRQRVALIVYTHHKEETLHLYGFMTPREKEIFQLLISVSGVGPKLARNVLSGIDAEELTEALAMGDLAKLKGVPGIGAKTAERLILELREKARATATATDEAGAGDKGGILHDIHSALVNLGYKSNQADRAVSEIRKSSDGEESFEELFKRALKALTRG